VKIALAGSGFCGGTCIVHCACSERVLFVCVEVGVRLCVSVRVASLLMKDLPHTHNGCAFEVDQGGHQQMVRCSPGRAHKQGGAKNEKAYSHIHIFFTNTIQA
jgi:hypothetical protein